MSQTEKNIDQLFLRKSYHELTDDEKLEISEIAKTESEFNDAKLMLLSIEREILSIEDIEPKEGTKKYLMDEFNRVSPAKSSRPMGLGIFFPSDKPFHQKLGVQLIGIAAAVVLMFTLFLPEKDKLSQNSETADLPTKEQTNEEQLIEENNTIKFDSPKEKEESSKEIVLNTNTNKQKDKKVDNSVVISNKETEVSQPASDLMSENHIPTISDEKTNKADTPSKLPVIEETVAEDEMDLLADSDFAAEQPSRNEAEKNTISTGSAKSSIEANDINTLDADESLAIVSADIETKNISSSMPAAQVGKESKTKFKIKTSKTLAENKELIKHFYTAM